MRALVCGLLLCSVVGGALGGIDPVPGAADHRVRLVPYDPNNVVQIRAHYDVETTIEYAPGEVILRATAGQAGAWSVAPSQNLPNILTLQPRLKNADTNLTVITDQRIYLYELRAREQWNLRGDGITFYVRHTYPAEINRALERRAALAQQEREQRAAQTQRDRPQADGKIDPAAIHLGYAYGGDASIAPLAVFDDGQFTYFQFAKTTTLPSIYTVDDNRREAVLNYRVQDPYIVVERTAERFTLRHGDQVGTVKRQALSAPVVVAPANAPSAGAEPSAPDW
jgi:type IV secretion system protein VirB9